MYRVELTTNWQKLPEFLAKYQDQEKFMAYCRECPDYATRWSCPPLSFSVKDFLQEYRYLYLAGVRVIYDKEIISAADTPEKAKEITEISLKEVKKRLSEGILAWEEKSPGSVGLASGGCHICRRCTREEERPCRHPRKMRYSLDSFGVDLTAVTKELLGIELQWAKGGLPEYYTLIHGLLTRELLPEDWSTFRI